MLQPLGHLVKGDLGREAEATLHLSHRCSFAESSLNRLISWIKRLPLHFIVNYRMDIIIAIK